MVVNWAIVASVVVLIGSVSGFGADKRAPVFDDFFRFESVGDVSLSPDGMMVAYALTRPMGVGKEPASPYEYGILWGKTRWDVWVVSVAGGPALNISKGDQDGASFWHPIWSPDSAQLLMMSTRRSDTFLTVRPWVWIRKTNNLRLLTNTQIDPFSGHVGKGDDFQWLSNHEVLFTASVGHNINDQLPPVSLSAANMRSVEGHEIGNSTASILDAGLPQRPDAVDTKIVIIDTFTEKERVVATASGAKPYAWRMTYPSPDGRLIAVLKSVAFKPFYPDLPLSEENDSFSDRLFEVEVVDLGHGNVARELIGSSGLSASAGTTVIWSPDSQELVISTTKRATEGSPVLFSSCRIQDYSCRSLGWERGAPRGHSDGWSNPESVVWFGEHNLLARESAENSSQAISLNGDQRRWRWQILDDQGRLDAFGISGRSLPQDLRSWPETSGLIGIADGTIENIGADGVELGPPANKLPSNITRIDRIDGNQLLFTASTVEGSKLFELNIPSGQIFPIVAPTPTARVAGFDGKTQTVLFRDDHLGIISLWVKHARDAQVTLLVEKNAFARELEPFRVKTFPYVTSDGADVLMRVLFPTGYIAGKRYPVVVHVYPGQSFHKNEDGIEPIEESEGPMENEQFLAAHGYVVMAPSMPNFLHSLNDSKETRAGRITDKYMELTKGVLPAIDKLVELGIADPSHIGLYGHSDGGFATLGLISETNRFKAAIAQSARADLLSEYGAFIPSKRYTGGSEIKSEAQMEEMIDRTDGPPWKNLWGYLRNSPIAYVDRVNTPLMIVQGDMDLGGIEQGEEFYTALQRQQKRVEFARYWGEGHVFQSPANIYDLWQRQFAWFDEFLKAPVPADSGARDPTKAPIN